MMPTIASRCIWALSYIYSASTSSCIVPARKEEKKNKQGSFLSSRIIMYLDTKRKPLSQRLCDEEKKRGVTSLGSRWGRTYFVNVPKSALVVLCPGARHRITRWAIPREYRRVQPVSFFPGTSSSSPGMQFSLRLILVRRAEDTRLYTNVPSFRDEIIRGDAQID